MKNIIVSVLFLLSFTLVNAQEVLSPRLQGKYHMISADEMNHLNDRSKTFVETAPPTGAVRNIAEFERNQGVIVSYPGYWGIPLTLIAELAEDVVVYVICETSSQSSVNSELTSAGVNMSNVEYVNAPLDSHWSRDYSPWFIEYGSDNAVGIVDFPYNRPRADDDEVPIIFGSYFNMSVFGMNMEHTGGNYMTDGMGVSASCDLVYDENSGLSNSQIQNLAADFLGADEYLLVQDPLDDYIEHIDCWGKFLDVDKILVARVPASDYRYADFEAMADYWANQTSSYGNNYQVFRTDWVVDGNAYTNSLIMNDKVLVPFNTGSEGDYNAAAAEAYEEAMPGYEIIGITYNDWYSTDALHCRTHEVPDFEMLRILHMPYFDEIDYQEQFEFSAEVYVFNDAASVYTVELFYSVNGGTYQSVDMSWSSGDTYSVSIDSFNEGETISYYIKAVDSNTKIENHPFIGLDDPNVFSIGTSSQSVFTEENSYVKAFPNPATDVLYLVCNDIPQGEYLVDIYNQNGEIVQSINLNSNQDNWNKKDIDISNLKSGLYFLKALSNKAEFSAKFVKL